MRSALQPDAITQTLEAMGEHPALASIARHPWFVRPTLRRFESRGHLQPRYTMVVPIFNQEGLMRRFIDAHLAMASLAHDIVAIFDCCADDSHAAFWVALEASSSPLVQSVASIVTSVPFFETACDNLGFVVAATEHIIEYQPDMLMATPGYDARMLRAFANERVFCVSGRCGHSLRSVYQAPPWPLSIPYRRAERAARIGLCGTAIQTHGMQVDDRQEVGYFSETVNRGPIAFRRSDLQALGFLDHQNFFLGDDDHDINLRAWLQSGRLPAYVPIRIQSDLAWGSTRKARDPMNADIYRKLKARPNHSVLERQRASYRPYQSPEPFVLPAADSRADAGKGDD